MLAAWTGYIAMEVELGHINEARSIYKRCYSKRFYGTGSEVYQASLISINIATVFDHKLVARWGAWLQHNSLVREFTCNPKQIRTHHDRGSLYAQEIDRLSTKDVFKTCLRVF
jgi:hypothetical protein